MLFAAFHISIILPGVIAESAHEFRRRHESLSNDNSERIPGVRRRAEDHEICLGELGCFRNDGDFQRPASARSNYLPRSREEINTVFLLLTYRNELLPQQLKPGDPRTIVRSNFRADRLTKIIVHGHTPSAAAEWMDLLSEELMLLYRHNVNVILVTWSGWDGEDATYAQAAADARVVGTELWLMISELQKATSVDPEKIHVIGHGLGAHAAGYAGKRIHHLGRITGLDPPEALFKGYSVHVRLDKTDATFVDVIHTHSESGTAFSIGHADYFPNGGFQQPGCHASASDRARVIHKNGFSTCDHSRAVSYFTKSVNRCQFHSISCPDYRSFLEGKCTIKCPSSTCNTMGLHALKPTLQNATFFLGTTARQPYCGVSHLLTLKVSHSFDRLTGEFRIELHGDSSSGQLHLTHLAGAEVIRHDYAYKYVVTGPDNQGVLTSVSLWLCKHSGEKHCRGSHVELVAKQVKLTNDADESIEFCNYSEKALDNGAVRLFPCPDVGTVRRRSADVDKARSSETRPI